MKLRVARYLTVAVVLSPALATPASAQSPAAELEARLPSLSGLERARTLAQLVDARKLDQPDQALRYGAEALRLFRTYPDPSANVATLNEMMWPHMTAGRYDSATFYADSARRFAVRAGNRIGQARALSNLGALAQRMGDPNRAADLFTQALAIQRAAGSAREAANSLNNLGFVYSTDLADYGKSLTYHLEALAIRQGLGDDAAIALSLNNLGIVYDNLHQYQQALVHFESALQLRRTLGNKARVASTLSNMGETYLSKGAYARALECQREALEIRLTLNDRSAIAFSHRNIGLVYLAMHELDASRRELLAAKALSDETPDKGLAVQVRLGLAASDRARGAPGSAEVYAREALAIADDMGSRNLVRQATEELASSQEAQGQLGDALRTFKRSKAVSDSIFSAEAARRIATLEQRFDQERGLREIDSLRRTQAELEVQTARRVSQRNGAAAIAILIAIAAFILYQRRVERERLAESLSMTDSLTGLRNRRYVQQTIEVDVAASVRRNRVALGKGVSIDDADLIFLMLDIDHFKAVNDAHGHAVGDQVLVQLGAVLRTTCRDSDVVVRWGGEEFLVIARFTDRHQGAVTAERLRQAIERHAVTLPNGHAVRVTCSIGYAALPVDLDDLEAVAWEDVIAMADRAAYSAKREGRNTCVGAIAGAADSAPTVS